MGNCPQGCFGKHTYLFVTAVILGIVVLASQSYLSAALAFAYFAYVWKREISSVKQVGVEEKKAEEETKKTEEEAAAGLGALFG